MYVVAGVGGGLERTVGLELLEVLASRRRAPGCRVLAGHDETEALALCEVVRLWSLQKVGNERFAECLRVSSREKTLVALATCQ